MDKYGWQIKPIDLQQNPELAARLGVDTTPSLILIKKGNDGYIPVSTGVTALDDIEVRLYRGIRLLNGDTTPENWSLYGFQKGQGFDINAPLEGEQ